ncbi:cytosine permease [Propionicimonas sp.]|uniref:purine-cytosine permease family protein n=1 Tax=Propionicimonas sp. TaxID=1955623 RepID=UPI00179C21B9|nr:cytosine permease [Propionicimonas sp.]MBU3975887.1 cytosine permease [Actinomycetota bacterium]MBA3019714.1 permease [Propionicimonas sp.]MBU3987604.1 cytosine permease [Actinomycetota bacterium]MBU4006471.1 cytosine permease [Actinomycetota bacterium]MBU4066641.1 cytosine permease [Actinomycetota bacterium]
MTIETRVNVEAPLTLTDSPPRTLGTWAQTALWASLGVTLFGPITGALVALTAGSQSEGLLACLVGTLIGAAMLGASAAIGARLGTPAMVGLRGLLGYRASMLPTVFNIAQNIGWAMMEIIVISTVVAQLAGPGWRWPAVMASGVVVTVMAVRPLGSVKLLRTVMLWLVLAGSLALFWLVLSLPEHRLDQSGVLGFWPAVDLAVAQVISFGPLAADYSRHSTSVKGSFWSAFGGYGMAILAYYALGVLAVTHLVGDLSGVNLITALMALPVGLVAIALLAFDELDDAFADVYSATVSVHNIAPKLDRRWVSVGVGLTATVLAGFVGFDAYQGFLFLIGSAFVPLVAVAIVDFFLVRRGRWDVSASASFRWAPALAWLLGFITYQLTYPGTVPGWAGLWVSVAEWLGVSAPSWFGATLGSVAVSAVAAALLGARPGGRQ